MPTDAPRFCVVVAPLPLKATSAEITQFFRPLSVQSVVWERTPPHASATVAFASEHEMEMACLRDNTLWDGKPLYVALLTRHVHIHGRGTALKNLYVLNLPLDVTTVQLEQLFGAHGTVRHCVILSMLDGQARRRGFVDMDTADEAAQALARLDGEVWCGYTLEVSYARVQRSDAKGGCARMVPCKTLAVHGFLPAATIDADDVRAVITPYAHVDEVAFPERIQGTEPFTVRVTLADANDAPAVWAALNGAQVRGQHLQITPDSLDV